MNWKLPESFSNQPIPLVNVTSAWSSMRGWSNKKSLLFCLKKLQFLNETRGEKNHHHQLDLLKFFNKAGCREHCSVVTKLKLMILNKLILSENVSKADSFFKSLLTMQKHDPAFCQTNRPFLVREYFQQFLKRQEKQLKCPYMEFVFQRTSSLKNCCCQFDFPEFWITSEQMKWFCRFMLIMCVLPAAYLALIEELCHLCHSLRFNFSWYVSQPCATRDYLCFLVCTGTGHFAHHQVVGL